MYHTGCEVLPNKDIRRSGMRRTACSTTCSFSPSVRAHPTWTDLGQNTIVAIIPRNCAEMASESSKSAAPASLAAMRKSLRAANTGANKTRSIEDGEIPYGGFLKVPLYLMTHCE